MGLEEEGEVEDGEEKEEELGEEVVDNAEAGMGFGKQVVEIAL